MKIKKLSRAGSITPYDFELGNKINEVLDWITEHDKEHKAIKVNLTNQLCENGRKNNLAFHPDKVEQCFCQSYYDENNNLKDCTCGKCGEDKPFDVKGFQKAAKAMQENEKC